MQRKLLRRTGRLVLACGGALAVGCVGDALGQASTPPPTPAPTAQPQPSRPPAMELTPEQVMEAQRRAAAAMQGGNQPAAPAQGENQPQSPALDGRPGLNGSDEVVTLSAFTEPVQLSSLVDLVATTLNINVVIKGELPGSVVFNAPVPVPKAELLDLLDSLLEQHGWSVVQDRFGMYNVQPAGEVKVNLTGEKPTTRVISTPNVRPSSLRPAIDTQLGGAMPGQPGQPGGAKHTYIDELGVIIATDTPRRLALLEQFIGLVLSEQAKAQFIRLPLTHVSAATARERALQLVGLMAQPTRSSGAQDANQQAQQLLLQQQQQMAAQAGSVANLNNMGERLTIDPTGNALIFRGQPEEINAVRSILSIIDRPSELVPRNYFAGSGARQIADLARGMGLGEIITIASQGTDQFGSAFGGINPQTGLPFQQNAGAALGGPMMVVDETKGTIVYYGTAEQQAQLDELIKVHDTNAEQVTIEVYKLRNSKAADVAEVINNLLSGSQPLGDAPLLPGGTGINRSAGRGINPPRTLQEQLRAPEEAGQRGEGLSIDESGFVIADEKNNQILVKARRGQQAEYEKLIAKLDLRRLQVFIEAKIVAITADDRTRLAFETQLINANGSGGVLNTNFGLGSFGTTGTQPILTPKVVGTGLSGFTAAIIKSDQVPIIMTALANETDSRIIATPQLLVNDNEEASVVSKDEVPYSTTTQSSGNNQVTGFGGYAEAGTELTVTPTISDTSHLRLEYTIEQSSFTGEAANGLPPPKQTNKLESASINVPSDSTVIVGGLVVNAKSRTKIKVPLIGDIPLVGALFADSRKGNRDTVLYVFLTPRILRDPGFEDLRLLTRGPQSRVKLDPDIPSLMPTAIDIRPSPVRPSPAGTPVAPAERDPRPDRWAEPAQRSPSRVEPVEPNPD